MNIVSTQQCSSLLGVQEHYSNGTFSKASLSGYSGPYFSFRRLSFLNVGYLSLRYRHGARDCWPIFSSMRNAGMDPDDSEDAIDKNDDSGDAIDNNNSANGEMGGVNSEILRENLERIAGTDDSTFSGIDLATLIRNKYGKSYDVQFIKKEFMGRNLLALNVMWKYMEQRSFPLTEEEYILRLDDVANTLKCWGAVSHIRNSLAKSKEKPRIGKAVSIFIDMDESGGRAKEWIYK
ncbi:DUF3067 domain-containing protein [Quillaja saponaria]|uniref:DUF3067 domain-containing protein n=1 Tax=Quillaja saponaria TaxID=32244 RepID=A0AAD7PGX5_QUISA|nr:DUF3067 domain-containing protein [Quillaja saponaria]